MSGILNIALSGLNDAMFRLRTTANNIVNASSTGKLPSTPGGASTAYEPQDVVTISNSAAGGVHSILQPRTPAYVVASDPNSPNADANGLVAVPNVNLDQEAVNATTAQFSYRADIAIIKAEKEMDKKLLDAIS